MEKDSGLDSGLPGRDKSDGASMDPTSVVISSDTTPGGRSDMEGRGDERRDGVPEQPTHFLVRSDPVDGLMQPVRVSTRVKYISMDVSKKSIALGTNTGVLYIFSRTSQRRVHVIPGETDGSIVKTALNGQGNLVAYATSKGHVLMCRLFPEAGGRPERLRCAYEHVGSTVLALQWTQNSDRLYIGDDVGFVTVVNFITLSQNALGSLGPPSETILKLDSAIVQIDTHGGQVLVSTKVKTVLCDNKRHKYSQIGKRPRDGQFGSCFYGRGPDEQPMIYCSRPGSRVWAVDHEGTVLNTHQFKQLLNKPPTPIFSINDWSPSAFVTGPAPGPQSIGFSQMLLCKDRYLLTCCSKGIYILDPLEMDLLLWNDQITDVEVVCCVQSEVYVLRSGGELDKLELLTVRELWTLLLSRQLWDCAGWLIVNFPVLTDTQPKQSGVSVPLLKELVNKVTKDENRCRLLNLIKDLEERDTSSTPTTPEPPYDKLDSGIYKIRTQTIEDRILQNSKSETQSGALVKNGGDDDTAASQSVRQDSLPEAVTHPPSGVEIVNCTLHLSSGESAMQDSIPVYPVSNADGMIKGRKIRPSDVGLGSSRSKHADRKPKKTKHQVQKKSARNTKTKVVRVENSASQHREEEENGHGVLRPSSDESRDPSPDVESPRETRGTNELLLGHAEDSTAKTNGKVTPDVSLLQVGTRESTVSVIILPETGTEDKGDDENHNEPEDGNRQSAMVKFSSVKEMISFKVKSTTKSVIQNIKDKKSQLTRIVSSQDLESCSSDEPKRYLPSELLESESELPDLPQTNDATAHKSGPRLPQINIEKLILATEECRVKMDAPSTLYRPDVAREALTSWGAVLNRTLWDLLDATERLKQAEFTQPDTKHHTVIQEENALNSDEHLISSHNEDIENALIDYSKTDAEGEVSETKENGLHEHISIDDVVNVSSKSLDAGSAGDVASEVRVNNEEKTVTCLVSDVQNERDTNCRQPHPPASSLPVTIRDLDKVLFSQDPFDLHKDTHKAASQLAQLCLSFSCYGNIIDTIFVTPNQSDCDTETETCNQNKDTSGRESCHGHENPEMDVNDGQTHGDVSDEMGIFMRCHFHLFSGDLSQTHQTVVGRCCEQRFPRWKTFVTCLLDLTADDAVTRQIMDTEVETAIDILRSQVTQRGIWALAFIVRLYGMAPQRTLAFCTEIWEHVRPLDVLYMTKMGSKVGTHFLLYARGLLNKVANQDWACRLDALCVDDELRLALLDCLLQARQETDVPLSCQCGLPWPGAHLQTWPDPALIQCVLGHRSAGVKDEDLCRSHGHWIGVIQLCLRQLNRVGIEVWDEARDVLQTTVLQLADISLLQKKSNTGYFPTSVPEWELLLQKRSKQSYGQKVDPELADPVHCLGCSQPLQTITSTQHTATEQRNSTSDNKAPLDNLTGNVQPPSDASDGVRSWRPDVTWEVLAAMLVRDVGLSRGLGMLQKTRVPDGALPMSFFASCVMAATLQNQQTQLTHNMLERVNTYLWSVKHVAMAPELSMAVLQEKRNVGSSTTTDRMFGQLLHKHIFVDSLEDTATRWGVCADLRVTCHACALPLQTLVSTQTGAIFFKCGHGFHRACSGATSCGVCSVELSHPGS